MSKLFSVLFFATILTACGNSNNQPVANTYGYNQNGYASQGGLCPQQVALDWNQLVAARCNNGTGPGNTVCARGVEAFMQRDQAYVQGVGCSIVTAQTQWGPGADWRGQQSFQINMPILQSILTQNGGPSSFSLQPGQVGTGQPGGF